MKNKLAAANPVLEIQHYLNDIAQVHPEIPLVYPTGRYDDRTRNAVIEFQEFYSLPVTGVVDLETWNKILSEHKKCSHCINVPSTVSCFPNNVTEFKLGDQNNCIYILQIVLNNFKNKYSNYVEAPITGIYDKKTKEAVKQFQQLSSLPVTGILNRETWNTLNLINNTCRLYD
ncbi:peptidoglycan-binding protein [Sedimentibacter sp.]|uniref:peptidoglycan-binding domain-containing protein n=1 Tax=Sedimentibacter sp. TaxID=1960295 RepID=UPI0028B083B8|nr:peptidoglycan-binding protein [Sedimentibacter sp.]